MISQKTSGNWGKVQGMWNVSQYLRPSFGNVRASSREILIVSISFSVNIIGGSNIGEGREVLSGVVSPIPVQIS